MRVAHAHRRARGRLRPIAEMNWCRRLGRRVREQSGEPLGRPILIHRATSPSLNDHRQLRRAQRESSGYRHSWTLADALLRQSEQGRDNVADDTPITRQSRDHNTIGNYNDALHTPNRTIFRCPRDLAIAKIPRPTIYRSPAGTRASAIDEFSEMLTCSAISVSTPSRVSRRRM